MIDSRGRIQQRNNLPLLFLFSPDGASRAGREGRHAGKISGCRRFTNLAMMVASVTLAFTVARLLWPLWDVIFSEGGGIVAGAG